MPSAGNCNICGRCFCMTALAEYQRHIRDLLKNRTVGELNDPHLQAVARSPELLLLRDIAVWWRELAVNGQGKWATPPPSQYGAVHARGGAFFCEGKSFLCIEIDRWQV